MARGEFITFSYAKICLLHGEIYCSKLTCELADVLRLTFKLSISLPSLQISSLYLLQFYLCKHSFLRTYLKYGHFWHFLAFSIGLVRWNATRLICSPSTCSTSFWPVIIHLHESEAIKTKHPSLIELSTKPRRQLDFPHNLTCSLSCS